MAWEYPKHTCGHSGERVQMYGPGDGRRKRLAAIEAQDCPDCRKAAANAASTASGLPLLSGSPKQVAWAVDIRERALRLHPDMIAKLTPETSAKWYIDNRFAL